MTDVGGTGRSTTPTIPTVPKLLEGTIVAWKFVVENTGNVTLYDVSVTDDVFGDIGFVG